MVSEVADIVTLCDCLGKVELCIITLTDTSVTAHSDVAEHCNLLVGTACLLPCLYKRTVMEVDFKLVVCAVFDIHFKNKLSGKSEKCLLESLERRCLSFIYKILTLHKAATLNCR